jgi:hypothetical protein
VAPAPIAKSSKGRCAHCKPVQAPTRAEEPVVVVKNRSGSPAIARPDCERVVVVSQPMWTDHDGYSIERRANSFAIQPPPTDDGCLTAEINTSFIARLADFSLPPPLDRVVLHQQFVI